MRVKPNPCRVNRRVEKGRGGTVSLKQRSEWRARAVFAARVFKIFALDLAGGLPYI